ncbi:MAG TPA: copper resistance CopC family protein [Mycobacterium sp.]|nr:copper resistance CopC family protein [Mycobacterium sp.]
MTRATRIALAGLLLAAMLLAAAGVAAAHAVMVSTDPAKGAEVSTGADRVSATFNERLQTTFAAMTVVGPDGHLWSTGEAQVQGPVVSVAVRPLGPAGTYTVNYRVTSADGHVVSGSWPFRLMTPGTGEPGPPVAVPGDRSGGDTPIWPFVVGAVAIVGVGLWLARPKS